MTQRVRRSGRVVWRVYGHVHDGVLFYVGSGRGERPLETEARSGAWHAFVRSIGDVYDVRIFAEYHDRDEALTHEAALIDQHRATLVNLRRGHNAACKPGIAANIRALMRARGWNQKTLAEAANVSQKTVSNLLVDAHSPRVDILGAVARALEVDFSDLLNESAA